MIFRPQRRRADTMIVFITMTCIPKWQRSAAAISIGRHWQFQPVIVARELFLQFVEMMMVITERRIFGKVLAYVWRVEWQARGLPHMHLLLQVRE
jgi:hypothetical protein